ncbi:hypothetical protein QN277_015784 [Acacia crassicarpa]|uniref:WIYLD domain-containing protein n=1 Tax=Acacia crassicarpa TaxID=499986 RepID=A0AAE1MVK7_9FABA|nr:hypothetical protein QN277_015784 [Acacia crassicarpa]
MASRPRGRRKNNHAPGNTRIDAALDAMRPYGFDERLVRETVKELLDVYGGTQGWPFIEEASYKLLIETMLSKQQISSEEKDNNARREGETVTSVAPSTCANCEAGSSNLADQDSLLVADPQTNDAQVSASLDGVASTQFQVEAENERISVDNAIGINNRNVDAKKVRLPVIRSSQPCDNVPPEICKPCYGWIENDIDDGISTQFRVEAENKRMSMDKSFERNIKIVDAKQVRPPVIQSSQPRDNYPIKRHNPSNGQIESDINDEISTQFRVEAENKRMSRDKSIGSKHTKNVDAKQVRPPVIQSSQPRDNVAIKRHKPSYGWIESDINDEVPTQFQVEAENKRISWDKSIGSKHTKNVDAKQVRPPVIQSSRPRDNVAIKRHKPSYGRIESDINDEVQTQLRVEAENKRMSVDKSIGSNIKNVDAMQMRPPVIQQSQPRDNIAIKRLQPCHGWISSDTSDEDLIRLPMPPLPEELIKSLRQNGAPQSGRRRRRNRWDEKPDNVMS